MFNTFLTQHSVSEYSFRSDIFPPIDDRTFWDAFQNEDCVRQAEAALDFDWPIIKATDFMEFKKGGNRKIMENPHFARRNHLVLFALAELKENKGRFLPQIVNGLFAICEETFWGLSAHWPANVGNIHRADEPYIDLFAAETAEHLSMIAALLRQPLTRFCPEILDRVEYELERRIKAPYLTHRDWFWMGYHSRPNNWNPWVLSNVLTVYLLTETNERRLHRALTKILGEAQFYYDALPADGGCDEGPNYWDRAGAALFEIVYLLKQATDGALNLFDDEKLKRIALYMKKAHTVSDLYVNVADAHATGKAPTMLLLYGFARETGQDELMNFSAAIYREKADRLVPLHHTLRTVRRLIYRSDFLREIMAYPVRLPLHGALEYLPDMQLAVLRRGSWCCSVKGGHNQESHNHNDVGDFTLYDGTTPVLVDVGIGVYTRFTFANEYRYTTIPWTQSLYHNLPVINREGQRFGKRFRSDRFEAEAGEVTVSFGGAYPAEAGVDNLTRTVTLTENGLICTDRLAFADANAKGLTEVLISVLPVRIEDNSVILGDSYRIRASHGNVRTEWIPFEDPHLESDWKTKGITRILIEAEGQEEMILSVEKTESR